MNRRRWILVAGFVLLVVSFFVVRNQVRVFRNREIGLQQEVARQAADAEARIRARPREDARAAQPKPVETRPRHLLLQLLQPVALENCRLERFGEPHDGGYLMCANLLDDARAGYSYGIAGYDKWGCDISKKLGVTVHQYDCFDPRRPSCPGGKTVFHDECVSDRTQRTDGRFFDTIANQLARNGDARRHIVMKIDVEGAEWESLLHAPDALLERIDQMAVEFHRSEDRDEEYLRVVQRLLRFFYVAHLHFNNFACVSHLDPLPAWAYEVLFVNKRVGRVDPSRNAGGLHPQDAPNNPEAPDCQLSPAS